jgi:serine/threonine-protein kinase
VELQPIQCDRDLLLRSLEETLSERQEERLIQHLSECDACQCELERLAADQAEWSKVSETLRRAAQGCDSFDAARRTPPDDETEPRLAEHETDFAVDFLEPSREAKSLGRLGDIEILGVIGRGAMGIVLKGFQAELNRPVAVKVLAPHLASSGAARQRFAREARATAAIVHPHVMPILSVHSLGRLPYLVMPYVGCESLQHYLDRNGPLAPIEVVRIGIQAARGLAAAHAQGLVHRDVKPANILLEKGGGRVMLTDFGLARAADDASLTRTGVIAGTPQYMSPEQSRGEAIDARSDLFSLGSVLYALCAGRPPFRAETCYGVLRRITDTEPRPLREVNPEVPLWLEAVIGRLHAKDPAARFATASETADLFEQCLAHMQQPALFSLPACAAQLAMSRQPTVDNTSPDQLSQPSNVTVPFTKRPWFAAIAALWLVGALAVSLFAWSFFGSRADSVRIGTMPNRSSPVLPRSESSATQWDDAAIQIDDALRTSDVLHAKVEDLWPAASLPAPGETESLVPSAPNLLFNSEQESTK